MEKTETARKFTFDVGWVFVSSVITMAIGFFLNIVVGNYFDAEGLGAYSMVLAIWLFVTLTAGIGVPEAIVKFVAEYKGKVKITSSLSSTAIVFGLTMGSLATLVVFLTAPFLEVTFNIPDLAKYLRIVSLSFPFVIANNVFLSVLNAQRMMKYYAIFESIRRITALVTTVLLINLGFGLPGAIWALVISPICVSMAVFTFHSRIFSFRLKNFKKYASRLVKFGGQIYFANAVGIINAQGAIVLIGYYMTDLDVGIYAVVLMFFNLILILPIAIQKVTYPALSTYFARKKKEMINRMIEVSMRFSYVFLSIISLLLIFYFDDAIGMFFPGKMDFLLAIEPLKILAFIGLLYGTIVSVGGIYISAGRPDISLKVSVFQAAVNIGLAIVLIPTSWEVFGLEIGGINGAVLSIGSCYIAGLFLFFILMRPCLKIRPNLKFLRNGFVLFVLVLLAGFLLTDYAGLGENIAGAILIPLYVLGLFATRIITKDWIFLMMDTVRGKRDFVL